MKRTDSHDPTDIPPNIVAPPRRDDVSTSRSGWTLRGAILRASLVVILGLGVMGVALLVPLLQRQTPAFPTLRMPVATDQAGDDSLPTLPPPPPSPPSPSPSPPPPSPPSPSPPSPPSPASDLADPDKPSSAALNDAMAGIVVIHSNDDIGTATLGAGFVVSSDGLVATNYHVIAEATEARATFRNGATYEIEGYAAVRPEEDLAIVRLRKPPRLTVLPVESGNRPEPLSSVIAIGHPQGLDFSPSDGRVSRVVETRDLPQRSRQFLRDDISSSANPLWIQHTAGISPGSSGGPLITPQGRVVGINTWVDHHTQFGYAMHISHVQQLLKERFDAVAPLDRYAKPAARVAALLQQLSGNRIRELYNGADAMNWLPRTAEQYEQLQQLAWSMTAATLPSTFTASQKLDDRLKELVTETDHVRRRLSQRKWDQVGQVTVINEWAANRLMEPMAGIVVFARVLRVVSGPRGSRGMLMQVAGLDQTIFIPLDGQIGNPPEGTHCLVLGVNYDGQVVRYGDNPLQLHVAPVIISEMVLEFSKDDPPPKSADVPSRREQPTK